MGRAGEGPPARPPRAGSRRGLRAALATLGLLAGLLSACGEPDGPAPSSPGAPPSAGPAASVLPRHVVLVLVEALRADHVGAWGYDRPTTPRLDALARVGVVYERAYAPSSAGPQSLASLWTGRLPSSGGAVGLAEATPQPSLPTLPRLARRAGLATGLATNHQHLWQRGFTRGCDALEIDSVPGRWDAARVTAQALDILDGWKGEPSLLVVDYGDASEPHLPTQAFRARFDAPRPEAPLTLDALRQAGGALPPGMRESPGYRDLLARYDAEIAAVDEALGALVDGLAARGLADDTLLVVAGTHGVEFLEHGYVGSGWTLHEEVLAVPLLLHGPRWLEPRRVAAPVSLVDLLPTLVEVLGLEAEGAVFDGSSLLAAEGHGLRVRPPRGQVLAELVIPELVIRRAAIRADVKLVETLVEATPAQRPALSAAYVERIVAMHEGALDRPDPWGAPVGRALYDLAADPGETRDAGEQRPGNLADLESALQRFARWCREHAPAAREAARPLELEGVEEVEALEEVGYL